MVKIGFIVEGDTEKIIFESDSFQSFLKSLNLECVGVFNAGGRGNLQNPNPTISSFFEILKDRSATRVFVVADLEDKPCISKAKEDLHIYNTETQTNIVAVKAIESWFLADSNALSQVLKSKVIIKEPEVTPGLPFEQINSLCIQHTGRGAGNKKVFAKKILKHGFLIQHAASHPDCRSAHYFLNKLKEFKLS
jgi:hypothetical protein